MKTPTRRRARFFLILTFCLAVAASAAGLVISRQGGSQAQAAVPGSASTRADLGTMQAALNSGSASKQAALLVPPLKFAPGSGPVFPAGTKVTIRPGTLRSDGQFGTVRADLPGGKSDTLGLYSVQGRWRLYRVAAGSAQTKATITAQPGGSARARLLSATSYACPDLSTIGKRTPVVLIHGYTGKPSDWGSDGDPASMFYKIDSIHGTYVLTFDYSKDSTQWVDYPAIGPAFADYIDCVAQASRDAHGPGKVIVVAHSMGGLVTRWAAILSDKAHTVTRDLARVITIGTPNTGTALAGAGDVAHQLLCGKSDAWLAPQAGPAPGSFCASWTAWAGMSSFGSEIKALPELPPGIPLDAIAGDESIRFSLGDATMGTVVLPLYGDGVVSTSSALHMRPKGNRDDSSAIFACTTLANPLGPCWHGALPRNLDVEQHVYNIIHVYVQAHQPAAPAPAATPSSAPTPSGLPLLVVNRSGYSGTQPSLVTFSGDATFVVQNITWTWGADSATGHGTSIIEGCVPDCAGGSQTPSTATITLSSPQNGQFTQVSVHRDGDNADSSGSTSIIQGAQQ
jgi:pimeloyl-ACP methyl ester carboxylesterase